MRGQSVTLARRPTGATVGQSQWRLHCCRSRTTGSAALTSPPVHQSRGCWPSHSIAQCGHFLVARWSSAASPLQCSSAAPAAVAASARDWTATHSAGHRLGALCSDPLTAAAATARTKLQAQSRWRRVQGSELAVTQSRPFDSWAAVAAAAACRAATRVRHCTAARRQRSGSSQTQTL